jgi:hypothetical protein
VTTTQAVQPFLRAIQPFVKAHSPSPRAGRVAAVQIYGRRAIARDRRRHELDRSVAALELQTELSANPHEERRSIAAFAIIWWRVEPPRRGSSPKVAG